MELRHVFGGNVVSLDRRMERMKYPAIAQVDAYWEGLREGRLMPDRAEVDPRGMEGALEFAFMLEQIAPGVARMRIAGMHLSDLLGMEVRGMPLSAFFEPAARDRLAQVIDDVVAAPKVADLRVAAARGLGRPALHARIYLAPLSNAGARYPRILGCWQSVGDIGRTPRRFEIEQVHMRRIVGAAGTEPAAEAPEPRIVEEPVPGFAEPQAGFAGTPATGRPKLRLVKSDD